MVYSDNTKFANSLIFYCNDLCNLQFFFIREIFKTKNIKIFFEILKLIFALIIMYIIGYFESSPINSVSSGYGNFKIDLFSFMDPKLPFTANWSMFLNDLGITHLEGFIYFGLGNIFLIIIAFILYIKNKTKDVLIRNNFPIFRILNLYIIILFLWSLTTNFSVFGNKIFDLNLPDYLFGVLSIFSSTGRFASSNIHTNILFFNLYL